MSRMVDIVSWDHEKNIIVAVPQDNDDEMDLLIIRGYPSKNYSCLGFYNTEYRHSDDYKRRVEELRRSAQDASGRVDVQCGEHPLLGQASQ